MLHITLLIISTFLAWTPAAALADGLSSSSRDTFERADDIVLPVEVFTGNCPSQIRLWQEYDPSVEAGDSLGIMLDVSTISRGSTEFINSQEHSVTFRTPLAPEFYNCVGYAGISNNLEASPHRRLYRIEFGEGYVYFTFDIGTLALTANEDWYFAGITHQDIVGQYPYVRWIVAD